MAVTIINYTGDGTTNQYAITFTYINQNDVAVTVNEVAAPFTFVNSSTVQITTTQAVVIELSLNEIQVLVHSLILLTGLPFTKLI